MMPMRLLTVLLLTLVAASPAQQPDDAAAVYDLVLTSPDADKVLEYSSWSIGFGLELRAPSGDYEIELSYAGTVHYLLALANQSNPLKDGRRRWSLYDPYLELQEGTEELRLRLLSLSDEGVGSGGRVLQETTASVTYRLPSQDKLDERVTQLAVGIAHRGLSAAATLDPREKIYVPSGLDEAGKRRALALRWIEARHDWLFSRVDILTQLGETYAYVGRPGDGLSLLRMAEQLYDREAGEMLQRAPLAPHAIQWDPEKFTYGPMHLRRLAEFYGRRMELDRSVHYRQLQIEFFDNQRKNHPYLDAGDREDCWEQASYAMGEIAKLSYAIRRDRATFDLWTKKAKEAWVKARPQEGGLLGE